MAFGVVVILVVGLLVVGLIYSGGFGSLLAPVTGGIVITTPSDDGDGKKVTCPDDLDTILSVRSTNPQNSSLDYSTPSHTVGYTVDGKFKASATVSSNDGSYSQIDTTSPCGQTVDVYSFNSANSSAVSKTGILLSGSETEVDLVVDKQSSLEFDVFNDTSASLTSGYVIDGVTSEVAMSQGDTDTYEIRLRPTIAQTSWGSEEVQNIVCGDFNTARYSKSAVTLSGAGVTELTAIPSFCVSDNNGDKAWAINKVSRSEGFRKLTLTVTADISEPVAADDVVFKFYEGSFYQANDGTIKGGISTDNLAAIGITDTQFTINLT